MDSAELQQNGPPEGWDWQADLREQERSVPWLARKTGKSQSAVYAYVYGRYLPPTDWLRDAWAILRKDVAA